MEARSCQEKREGNDCLFSSLQGKWKTICEFLFWFLSGNMFHFISIIESHSLSTTTWTNLHMRPSMSMKLLTMNSRSALQILKYQAQYGFSKFPLQKNIPGHWKVLENRVFNWRALGMLNVVLYEQISFKATYSYMKFVTRRVKNRRRRS